MVMTTEELWAVGGGSVGGASGTLTRTELERIRGGLTPDTHITGAPTVSANGHTPPPVKACSECNRPAHGARPTCGNAECVAARRRRVKRGSSKRIRARTTKAQVAATSNQPTPAPPSPPGATQKEHQLDAGSETPSRIGDLLGVLVSMGATLIRAEVAWADQNWTITPTGGTLT